MAFDRSSKHVDIVDGYLTATCTNTVGRDCRSELNLDAHLGNANGFFEWGGTNFSRSAEDIVIRRQGGSTFLHAKLRTQHKSWRDARVNISERIANLNGELKYVGSSEPKTVHSQDFLGEERDFLSAAISDTINDLRELFTGPPLFSSPAPRPRQEERTRSARDQRSEADDAFSTSTDHFESRASRINLEDATSTTVPSTEESLLDSQSEASTVQKGEPPAYDEPAEASSSISDRELQMKQQMRHVLQMKQQQAHVQQMDRQMKQRIQQEIEQEMEQQQMNQPAEASSSISDRELQMKQQQQQQETNEQEDAIMQEIRDFLCSGNGHNVHSFKAKDGNRKFVLRQDVTEIKTLTVHDRTLFDQDEYRRRDSVSTLSDHGKYQARCMTPSVVDGEDEYDFMN